MTHTPGPWEVVTNATSWQIVERGKHIKLASVLLSREADARLIAAAPALLEALESVDRWLDTSRPFPPTLRDKIRAAIAQAKGE